MRENTGLWVALLVVGGLLLAGLAGVGAMLAFKTQAVRQGRTAEAKLAEAEAKPAPQKEKGTAPTKKTAEPPAEPTAAEKWNNAAVREYAKKLLKDYQGNAVAADNKYKDRTVGVVGEVSKVDTLNGKPVVILKGAAVEEIVVEYVFCVCDDADRDKLAELADGHWVALVGRCTGKQSAAGVELASMVKLQGCSVVHVTRTEAEMNQAFPQKK